jgi:hypothetical protein
MAEGVRQGLSDAGESAAAARHGEYGGKGWVEEDNQHLSLVDSLHLSGVLVDGSDYKNQWSAQS